MLTLLSPGTIITHPANDDWPSTAVSSSESRNKEEEEDGQQATQLSFEHALEDFNYPFGFVSCLAVFFSSRSALSRWFLASTSCSRCTATTGCVSATSLSALPPGLGEAPLLCLVCDLSLGEKVSSAAARSALLW